MEFLLFDMDGVLIKPRGYHRALRETVRLAGIATKYGAVKLSDQQITHFESLGISSEWHSSALCMAVMVIMKQAGMDVENKQSRSGIMDLEDLFEAIAAQPMRNSALHRGQAAIEMLAAKYNQPNDRVSGIVADSESIQCSPTLNWFQELILGSENFAQIYQRKSQFQTESYLELYDKPYLNASQADKVMRWVAGSGQGAAIMTNRPSHGPSGFSGMPDAEMGSHLVGLEVLPMVGKGEILWLADFTGFNVENFSKPTWKHAMAAILVAGGWPVEDSLKFVAKKPTEWNTSALKFLQETTVTVFEDTPGGLVSVQAAGDLLENLGIQFEVQKIGIADDEAKQSALTAQGAVVYPDINQALGSLNDF